MGNFDQGKDIDQLFASRLDEVEFPVPEGAWDKVASAMESDRLHRKVFWARFTAAASILLVLGLGAWMTVRDYGTATPQYWSGNVIALPGDALASKARPKESGESRAATFTPNSIASNASASRAASRQASPARNISNNTIPVSFASQPAARANLNRFFIDEFGPVQARKVSMPTVNAPTRDVDDIHVEEVELGYDPAELAARVNQMMAENPELNTPNQAEVENIFTETLLTSQNNGNARKKSRWALGGAFSPDYTFAFQSPVQAETPVGARTVKLEDPAEAAKETTDFVTAFSTGMRVGVDLSERISLQSGVMYSRRTTSDASQLTTSFGKTQSYNTEFNLNLLELPVTMRYNVISKDNFNYYVASGLSTHLLWNYQNTLTDETGTVNARRVSDDENTLRPSQANIILSTGVRYNLLNKLSMNLEPGVRYGILNSKYSFNQNNGMTFSLTSGINYHF